MNQLRVSILQMDIAWENKQDNLRRLREKLEALRGATEIIVLPETFSTGFSMNTDTLAEPVTGNTITTLRQWASEYQIAIAGSYIACEENFVSSESNPSSYKNSTYYNRAFFLTPEGKLIFTINDICSAWATRQIISRQAASYHNSVSRLEYTATRLLRPALSGMDRNTGNEYDLLIYVPTGLYPDESLGHTLQARALENISYVCGVNRIGKDSNSFSYNGGSAIYSYKGEMQIQVPDHEEGTATATLELSALQEFRNKFPAWKDADSFTIVSDSNSR